MPKPCGCTDLIYCEQHAKHYSLFGQSLANALASAMFGSRGPVYMHFGPIETRDKIDRLIFSDTDVVYLKKLRISPE